MNKSKIVSILVVVLLTLPPVQAEPDLSQKTSGSPQSSLFPSFGDRLRAENAEGGWFKTHPVLSVQEIAKLAQKSTGVLQTKAGQGTGFFVGNGILVTNYHMISDGITDSDTVSIRSEENFKYTEYKIEKILAADKDHDVALLQIAGAKAVPPLLLASHNDPQVGDEIYIYGNPQGYEGTFAVGRISAFRMKAQVDGIESGVVPGLTRGDCIQYTVPTSPGSSGSPVLNNRGEVIGVHCAGPNVPDGASGKSAKYELMNFAVSARYIKELLHTGAL